MVEKTLKVNRNIFENIVLFLKRNEASIYNFFFKYFVPQILLKMKNNNPGSNELNE